MLFLQSVVKDWRIFIVVS